MATLAPARTPFAFPDDGLVDEVRISYAVLAAPELRIEGFTPVPEPSTALLLGLSLRGLGAVQRHGA